MTKARAAAISNPVVRRFSTFSMVLVPTLQSSLSDSRSLSAVELLLGASIVIGHNVFKVLPNEVPILFVLGLLSMRLRNGGWSAMGLQRPTSWPRVVRFAVGAATVRIVLGEFVIDPLTALYWPPAIAPSGAEDIKGDLLTASQWFLIVWTFAAFGEEIAYRGYLITRAADLGRRSPAAYWIGIVLVSILFGYGHYFKGPAGIIDSGAAGFVLGAAYLLSGRNLWTSILAHGFIDTFGIAMLYFGWDS